MALLTKDIVLDEDAFTNASADMEQLKKDADALNEKLKKMCEELKTALDSKAGDALKDVTNNVNIKPIENLCDVINHISETLNTIIGTGYYKDIFVQYEKLNG